MWRLYSIALGSIVQPPYLGYCKLFQVLTVIPIMLQNSIWFHRGWGIGISIGSNTNYVAFPHHYQGRIDFNTVNLCQSTGMDLVSIPAGRVVLANPVPRAKIFQSCP